MKNKNNGKSVIRQFSETNLADTSTIEDAKDSLFLKQQTITTNKRANTKNTTAKIIRVVLSAIKGDPLSLCFKEGIIMRQAPNATKTANIATINMQMKHEAVNRIKSMMIREMMMAMGRARIIKTQLSISEVICLVDPPRADAIFPFNVYEVGKHAVFPAK